MKGAAFSPVVLALALLPLALQQDFGSLDAPPARSHQFVTFVTENVALPAGRKTTLELRFQIEGGYHVNSHTPKSDLQIPTVVEFEPAAGVKAATAEYPAGQPYSFSFDPREKLDVYAGAFTVRVPLTATAGDHELKGILKYQACDHAACYPPKSLPVRVLFTAK